MKKNLLLLIALFTITLGHSQAFTENFITYQIISSTDQTVRTNGYDIAGGTVVDIPATVTNSNSNITYDVIEIGTVSFYDKQLTSVTIPSSALTIEALAFAQNQLTNVIIPNGVTSIGNVSFQQNLLTDITIPDSVTFIDFGAFQGNTLTNVSLSNNLTSIGDFGFYGNQLQSVTIPNSVISIGQSAFKNNPLNSIVSEAVTPPAITTGGSNDTFSSDRSGIDLTIPTGTTGPYVTDVGALWINFNSVTEDLQVGDTYSSNYITYEVTSTANNTVKAIDYNVAGGDVVDLPATLINGLRVYDVTAIGDLAFQNYNLTAATIPNSILSIGSSAFASNQLTSFIIPENVTSLGINTFENNQLESVTIPSNVTNIGARAFKDNPITTVISENITPPTIYTENSIYDSFNSDRSGINLIIPDSTTGAYVTDSGALWTGFNFVYELISSVNSTLKVTEYNETNGSDVTIPSVLTDPSTSIIYDVIEIGTSAFHNKSLTNVTIPASIISIGDYAFSNNQLMSITIPDGITTTGNGTFGGNQLTSVTLPASLITIGYESFLNNNLQSLIIPNNVTSIEDSAFEDNQLTGVTLSENLSSIGNSAFAGNELATVVIPNSVTSIGVDAFSVNQLTSVTISNSLSNIENGVFADNLLTSITVPESITSIGDYSFINNQLTEITFSENITNIGARAFQNNILTDVYSESLTPPMIVTGGANDTFGDRSGTDLHIPIGTTGVYVTDTGALWTDFNMVIEDILSTSDFEIANRVKIITSNNELNIISAETTHLTNYTIYAMSGSKIKEGPETTIAIGDLSRGIYLLEMTFNTGKLIKKFAK